MVVYDFYSFLKRKKLLITIFILLTIFTFVPNYVNCEPCHDLDIRNSPANLRKLENCTHILGFLQIMLMDKPTHNFSSYSFPKLREITGYFFMYRVYGLRSLSTLFPNLIVIRGQVIKLGYALLIYEVEQLQDVGLKSLISIQNGYARIQKNPSLCFVHTIDWARITSPGGNFVHESDENQCPSTESCRGCSPKNCWSVRNCQRIDNHFNFQRTIECHPQCLGGCFNRTASGCYACRGPTNNGVCVEECPENKILHMYSYRCVSPASCRRSKNIIFEKTCIAECPTGYSLVDSLNEDEGIINQTCHPCKNSCEKACPSAEIVLLSDSDQLKGCTFIEGSLNIKLNEDTKDLMKILEENLGEIVEILDHLKIYRSMSLSSLSFLRSLTMIHGNNLIDGKYALAVYENFNIQTLWDWKLKTHFNIIEGSMFFHYNNKLCMSEIDKFREITSYSNVHDFIGRESNGYKQSCNILLMKSKASVLSTENVTILWEQLIPTNLENTDIGYLINYIEAPKKDITAHYGRDVCSQFSWKSIYVPANTVLKVSEYLALNLTKLKPFTQYAYYVKTYFLQEEPYETKESQSEVKYFKTLPGTPNAPKVTTLFKTDNSITIGFSVDEYDEELIDYFTVEVLIQPDDPNFLDQRDFCEYPKVTDAEQNKQTPDIITASAACCLQNQHLFDDEDDDDDDIIELSTRHEKYINCIEGYDKESCELIRYNNRRKRDLLSSINNKNNDNYGVKTDLHSWTSRFDDFRTALFKMAKPKGSDGKQMKKHNSHFFKIEKDARDFTISNLKPFSLYTVLVVTCHNIKMCSPFYMHTDRTASLEKADDITFTITNSSDIFYLHFNKPEQPNGLTVAYNIDVLRLDNSVNEKIRCITRRWHEHNNNIYTLSGLNVGGYGVRIRSVSLAGNGHFTDMQFIHVSPPIPDNTLKYSLIGIFIAVLLCIGIGTTIYWNYRKNTNVDTLGTELMANVYLPNVDIEDREIDESCEGAVGGIDI